MTTGLTQDGTSYGATCKTKIPAPGRVLGNKITYHYYFTIVLKHVTIFSWPLN